MRSWSGSSLRSFATQSRRIAPTLPKLTSLRSAGRIQSPIALARSQTLNKSLPMLTQAIEKAPLISKLPPSRKQNTDTDYVFPRVTYSLEDIEKLEELVYAAFQTADGDVKRRLRSWLKLKLGAGYRPNFLKITGDRMAKQVLDEARRNAVMPKSETFEVSHNRVETTMGAGGGGVFAVVELQGSQYKVVEGDQIIVEHLRGVGVAEEHVVKDVLLLGSPSKTIVGRPRVPNATVTFLVEQHVREAKQLTFKKRRSKKSQRLRGSRHHVTVLRVMKILLGNGEEIKSLSPAGASHSTESLQTE